MQMNTFAIILLLFFAFGAAFVQRVTGFGFGIFIMTLLPHIMPSYGEATALSGMLALLSSAVTAAKCFRDVPWKKMVIILAAFLIVSFFSVKTVSHIDSGILRKVLGITLIAISIYFFLANGRIRLRPSPGTQLAMGGISGIMGGLFAMQGPPAVIYFISCSDTKEEYIALTQWYFVIGNLMMTFFRAGNGFVTGTVGRALIIAVPAAFAGLYIGRKVYDRMPIEAIRKAVYGFIAIAGLIAVIF